MKSFLFLLVGLAACSINGSFESHPKPNGESFVPVDSGTTFELARTAPKFEVHFSPKGGCTDAIVRFIGTAKTSIFVQAYSFTSKPIESALEKKAPLVHAILDRSDVGTPGLQALIDSKIDVRIDLKHAIAHNKVIEIDGIAVETGSFNFTGQAENSNAENCLFIRDKDLAKQYADEWQIHYDHSVVPSEAPLPKASRFN